MAAHASAEIDDFQLIVLLSLIALLGLFEDDVLQFEISEK